MHIILLSPFQARHVGIRSAFLSSPFRATSSLRKLDRQTHLCGTSAASSSRDYLVGHKIIVLHLVVTLHGTKFDPSESCTQIRVCSQMDTPNQTVLFPEAYDDNEPDLYIRACNQSTRPLSRPSTAGSAKMTSISMPYL